MEEAIIVVRKERKIFPITATFSPEALFFLPLPKNVKSRLNKNYRLFSRSVHTRAASSVILREEHSLRVFGSWQPRRVFGRKYGGRAVQDVGLRTLDLLGSRYRTPLRASVVLVLSVAVPAANRPLLQRSPTVCV